MAASSLTIFVVSCSFWFMQAFPLRIIGYNPLSASCEDRQLDIVKEAAAFDLIHLIGTGIPKSDVYTSCQRLGHRFISTGYVRSSWSNKSCGCALAIGGRLKNARIYDPLVTSGKLSGRGLAVRIANGSADVFAVCAYFPPCPRAKAEYPAYKQTCRALAGWLSDALCKCPASSLPVICTDVNDGMGLKKTLASTINLDTSVVPPQAARVEKLPGGAGELFRLILEQHDMFSATAWFDPRATYFGNESQSLIDHICIPWGLYGAVRSAGPLYTMSKRLQLIMRNAMADNAVLHLVVMYIFSHPVASVHLTPEEMVDPSLKGSAWDMDLLLRGLREGLFRKEFIDEIEKEMEDFVTNSAPALLENSTPDAFFGAFDAVVIQIAQKYFKRGKKVLDPRVNELAL